nr:hypothetical protein [Sphingopyxis indica]
MPRLLEVLARNSARPRYAFMVLNLIAGAAGPDGRLGPIVLHEGEAVPVRDWLCDALAPMGDRDPRRLALFARVREELASAGQLGDDPDLAERAIEAEVRARARNSGKTNVSRAVSELVRAGMITRHYQGYRIDHENRGAQRQAVYTLTPLARGLLQPRPVASTPHRRPQQAALPF